MPITIAHSFVSPLSDTGNPNEVGPGEWNASHPITMSSNFVIGRSSAGDGPAEEIPMGAGGRSILALTSGAQGDIVFRGLTAWARLGAGLPGQFLRTNGPGANPDWASSASINLGTPVNSTSGTAIDFTGIPAGVRRIVVMLRNVSTDGTNPYLVQLGDAGGIEATGYSGNAILQGTTGTTLSSGFVVSLAVTSSQAWTGSLILSNVTGSAAWVANGQFAIPGGIGTSAANLFVAGNKTLSDVLTQVRVTTSGGTNTFDAGTINISWEF
jgi:hypothetical protein